MRVVHVLRKPLSEGTVAANTLKHGCGGLHIAVSRISTGDTLDGGAYAENPTHRAGEDMWTRDRKGDTNCFKRGGAGHYEQPVGRWPANMILQHLEGCRCEGTREVKNKGGVPQTGAVKESGVRFLGGTRTGFTHYFDPETGAETVANWICEPGCPVVTLDEQSGSTKSTGGRIGNAQGIYTNQGRTGWGTGHEKGDPGFGDVGGASRFFKQVGGTSG